MTNKEFETRKRKIELKNRNIRQQKKLKELKNKYKKKKKKLSMSKLIILLVLLFCSEIAIFAEIFMWHYANSDAMYSLIGIPIALMPTLIAYFNKSKAENTSGGIVYDMAMLNSGIQSEEQCSDDSDNAVG